MMGRTSRRVPHSRKSFLIAPARAKLGGMLPTNMVRFCRPVPSLTTGVFVKRLAICAPLPMANLASLFISASSSIVFANFSAASFFFRCRCVSFTPSSFLSSPLSSPSSSSSSSPLPPVSSLSSPGFVVCAVSSALFAVPEGCSQGASSASSPAISSIVAAFTPGRRFPTPNTAAFCNIFCMRFRFFFCRISRFMSNGSSLFGAFNSVSKIVQSKTSSEATG
mmetsp:Transcript_106364/g.179600  ORF Transcript_106364/g.179600 Transcript_106364/m.179600 type:complete len:222 (+) Transcript_106364:223-888(+)